MFKFSEGNLSLQLFAQAPFVSETPKSTNLQAVATSTLGTELKQVEVHCCLGFFLCTW